MSDEANPNETTKQDIDIAAQKLACGKMLKASNLKVTTVKGRTAIHAFWVGVLSQANDMTNPYVVICLMSGRHDDLVDMGETK